MKKSSYPHQFVVCVVFIFFIPTVSNATVINFSGTLDIVETDLGNAIYSGTPTGTLFNGFIDDDFFNGSISDGTTLTSFSCCIAAGGLSLSNDFVINSDDAIFFNELSGTTMFSSGDIFDGVNIEGDATVPGGGRVEIGLSYILDSSTFSDTNPNNYPFNPDDVILALFFITEENSSGNDIYSAVGKINAVPLPAAIWLFIAGLLGLAGMVNRSS